MSSSNILHKDHEVMPRLESLGMTKNELLRVVHQAVIARNESVDNDPNNAPGLLAYIHGTREIREVYLPKGWRIDRTDNIEATVNPASGMKLIYQNSDSACNPARIPNAISRKGIATARLVENQTRFLFPEMEKEALELMNQSVWFLCVSINEDGVCAELFRPRSIENSQFEGYIERIFIISSGEWGGVNVSDKDNDNDYGDDGIEVTITKK